MHHSKPCRGALLLPRLGDAVPTDLACQGWLGLSDARALALPINLAPSVATVRTRKGSLFFYCSYSLSPVSEAVLCVLTLS